MRGATAFRCSRTQNSSRLYSTRFSARATPMREQKSRMASGVYPLRRIPQMVGIQMCIRDSGMPQSLREDAFFRREDGRWYYVDGNVHGQDPYRRETPKIGRNEPCPCGSGKKYKKCCGK